MSSAKPPRPDDKAQIGRLTPAHKQLIALVAKRAYESLKKRNQQASNAASQPQSPSKRILRLRDVEQKVGLRKAQIYGLMKTGEFPAVVKLTARTSGWMEHEINNWLLSRAAPRDSGT